MPQRGTLKVFLGMAPGVGKTYAMLQAGIALQAQDHEVLAAIVETHGRTDTAALLAKLPTLPRARLPHRDTTVEELDLDALLARRPQLALIDELAHTNAPGSRHPKRWQDVAEVLDAGIDVFTTLNIQHLESRADIVASVTGAPVRETVPDRFLERADELELIDLTPRDLRRRLEEGKVYLGDRATAAAANFFRESHLTALRQLALRYAAERVGSEVRHFQSQQRDRPTWRTQERLLVAVGPSPFSPALIRRTRAMAAALDAPWFALALRTDAPLTPAEQQQVAAHLDLARQLGAETATVEAPNLVQGILDSARERGITQIVIGKSRRRDWLSPLRRPPALAILEKSGDIDVLVIEPGTPAEGLASPTGTSSPEAKLDLRGLPLALALAAAFSAFGLLAFPFLGADNLALLTLAAVVASGLVLRTPAVLALAVVSGLLWNFLFTEPRFTFEIHDPAELTMFGALTFAALATGSLTSRLRRRQQSLARQQRHNARLLDITAILAASHDNSEAIRRCLEALASLFPHPAAIQLRRDDNHQLGPPHPASTLKLDPRELAVADYAFEKKQPAGRSTDTLPQARALHLPLQGRSFVMGVLSVDFGKERLDPADRDLLAAVAAQLGLALERNHLLRAVHHAEFLERSDQLRRSLLDHVSHELRTPVAVLGASLDALQHGTSPADLAPEMRQAHRRLRHVVEQLVESARVESGSLQPQPEWWDLLDLCETARERSDLGGHPFEIQLAADAPPLVWIDGELTLAVLVNLLENAARHTPPGTPIELHAALSGETRLELRVRDHGPGLADPARAFDRFRRGPNSAPGGLGLGLSIVKGLVRGLGGEVTAHRLSPRGTEFLVALPVRMSEDSPPA